MTNLIKNVYVHSEQGVEARAAIVGRKLIVENQGREMLDREHIFERFYQGSQRETSMGLGLALVAAICRHYNINIEYSFVNGSHRFEIDFAEYAYKGGEWNVLLRIIWLLLTSLQKYFRKKNIFSSKISYSF